MRLPSIRSKKQCVLRSEVHDEEGRRTHLQAAVGDRGRQVRLAAAAGAGEDEPPFGSLREGLRVLNAALEPLLVAGVAAASPAAQIGEREAGEGTEVAVSLETAQAFLFSFVEHAIAGKGLAEVGVAEGDVPAHEAGPSA